MAENLAGKTFDVQTFADGRWTTANLHNSRSAALAQAEELVGQGDCEAVRVIAESDRTGTETIYEEQLGERAEKPVQIVPVDDAPQCADEAAFYGFESRRTIGRLMRHYLDRQGLSALELLFDAGLLMALERDDRLFPSAVQRIAAIQAKKSGETQVKRTDALYAFVEAAKLRARETDDADALRAVIESDGLEAAVTAARTKAGSDTDADILLAFALARFLGRHGDWTAKLGAAAGLAPGVSGEPARAALDGMCAELLDGGEAIYDLLGRPPDLGSATRLLIRLARGHAADTRAASEHLPAVNAMIAGHDMALCKRVLLERAAANIAGTRPLDSDGDDRETFMLLVRECIDASGLCGGWKMAGALAARARIVLRDGDDDLSAVLALRRVLNALPHILVRLGFVLDLAVHAVRSGDDPEVMPAAAAFDRVISQIETTEAVFSPETTPETRRRVADGLIVRAAAEEIPAAWRPRIEAALKAVVAASAAAAPPPIKPKTIGKIAMTLETISKPAGEILFEEGDPGDSAFLVRHGEIEIFRTTGKGEAVLGRIGRGEIVGEIALLDGLPRSASARVLADTELVVITRDDFDKRLERLEDTDSVVRRLIDTLVRRVRGLAAAHE